MTSGGSTSIPKLTSLALGALAILCVLYANYDGLQLGCVNSVAVSVRSHRPLVNSSARTGGYGAQNGKCFSQSELDGTDFELMRLPAVSYDESLYIISSTLSVRERKVMVMLPDPKGKEWPRKFPSLRNREFTCGFESVAGLTSANKVRDTDGHYYVVLCPIPEPALQCIVHGGNVPKTAPAYEPQCLVVNLYDAQHTVVTDNSSSPSPVLLARFKVCQEEQPRDDYLALCSQPITPNVWPLIPQWLEYHLMVGVEHFYLYSVTGTREGLQHAIRPYFDSSAVTFRSWMSKHWPGRKTVFRQVTAQCDCLYRNKDHAKWIVYIDIDEYLLPAPKFHQDIKHLLRRHEDTVAVMMKSINFMMPAGAGLNNLAIDGTRRLPGFDDNYMKYICQPAKTIAVSVHRITNPHWQGRGVSRFLSNTSIAIHHYRHIPDGSTIVDKSLLNMASELRARLRLRLTGSD